VSLKRYNIMPVRGKQCGPRRWRSFCKVVFGGIRGGEAAPWILFWSVLGGEAAKNRPNV